MPSERGIQFLSTIWRHQLKCAPPGQYYITLMKREGKNGYMSHKAMPASVLNQRMVFPLPDNSDWYWCPNLFCRPKRKMIHGVGGAVLYQDLDEVSPDSCSVKPTWWWETSPQRYQAIWLMSKWLDVGELLTLNKALNREVKADKGTWNLTRLLRVPGSWSDKRQYRVGDAQPYGEFRSDAA